MNTTELQQLKILLEKLQVHFIHGNITAEYIDDIHDYVGTLIAMPDDERYYNQRHGIEEV